MIQKKIKSMIMPTRKIRKKSPREPGLKITSGRIQKLF